MARTGMTISDAAHSWVREMNAYPQDMIDTLIKAKPDDWSEVTTPRRCDRVYVFNLPEGCESNDGSGEIEDAVRDTYIVKLDDGTTIETKEEDFEVERDDFLPMWGWMWSFGDSADDYWLEELDGVEQMSRCGFRVYHNEEWGYFFGIDGAGYDFYSEHWIPAYKARGLEWHDPKAEQEYRMRMKGCEKKKLGNREYWFKDDEIVEEVL